MSANLEAFQRLQTQGETAHGLTSEKARQAMFDAFAADFEIIQPPSLPHGGETLEPS